MEGVGEWFSKEVYVWRRIASLIWVWLLVPPITWLFFLMATFSVIHPYSWVSGLLWFPISPSIWLYCCLLALTQVGLTLHKTSFYTIVPPVKSTLLSNVWSILAPPRLLHTLTHALGGGFTAWCFIATQNGAYTGLTKACDINSQSTCLNEHHLFLVLCGVTLGTVHSMSYFYAGGEFVAFPTIQQAKFFTIKSSVASLLSASTHTVLRHLRAFYVFYFLFGSSISHWFVTSLGVKNSPETSLSSFFGLIDLSLLWQCFITAIFTHFLWSLSRLLFAVFITESYQLPIESAVVGDQSYCLHQALACDSHILVQHLGYQDLCLLSRFSPKRRKQLFTLSLPGGHPHNWNRVVTECLRCIESLTTDVMTVNRNSKVPVRQGNSDRVTPPITSRRKLHPSQEDLFNYTSFNQESISSLTTSTYGDSSLVFRDGQRGGSGTLGVTSPRNGHAAMMQQQTPSVVKPSVLDQFKKKPVVAYFLDDLPDVSSRRLFAGCQKQIWALEALSNLIVASYHEDTYGVVQKSLPDVISAILSLQEAVDKHLKLSANISRQSGLDASLRFSLRSSVRSCLYRITETFHHHIRKIDVSPEHNRLLELYLEHKE